MQHAWFSLYNHEIMSTIKSEQVTIAFITFDKIDKTYDENYMKMASTD